MRHDDRRREAIGPPFTRRSPRHTRAGGHSRRRQARLPAFVGATILWISLANGCTSPPAVTPLLRVVDQTLRKEAAWIEAEAVIDSQRAEQTRRVLADAYRADLRQRDTLDVAWVEEATTVYIAAREAVLRNEFDQKAARQQRTTNLRSAAAAQRRAIYLLERQDDLIVGTLGIDLWQLFDSSSPNPSENP